MGYTGLKARIFLLMALSSYHRAFVDWILRQRQDQDANSYHHFSRAFSSSLHSSVILPETATSTNWS